MSKQHHDRSTPPTDTTVLWFSTAGKIPPHAEQPRPALPTRHSRPQPQVCRMLLALCCLPLALALCVAAQNDHRSGVRPRVSIHIILPAPPSLCPASEPTLHAPAPTEPAVAPPPAEPPRKPPPSRRARQRPRSSS